MLYILDTNAFSDLMRRHPKVEVRFTGLAPSDRVADCTIVRGQILHGLEQLAPGAKRTSLETQAKALWAVIPCESITAPMAAHYARIKQDCRLAGVSLDENDLWIAGAVKALGATLVTRDADFTRVPGLLVEDWSV